MGEIAVIDYGMGNLHSASKALEHVAPDERVIVTADPGAILAADRVVFPGVGAMRDCMGEIRRLGIDTVVRNVLASGRPLLAICVGMQALLDYSEENDGVDCLGLIGGRVRFFGRDLRDADGRSLKVPHMGWNRVRRTRDHPLWEGIDDGSRFYFVHSYYAEPTDDAVVAGRVDYGVAFAAALADRNLFAVQFHPEKSDRAGLRLLANFVRWDGRVD